MFMLKNNMHTSNFDFNFASHALSLIFGRETSYTGTEVEERGNMFVLHTQNMEEKKGHIRGLLTYNSVEECYGIY